MELFRKIERLEELFQSANETLKQAQNAVTSEKILEHMQDALSSIKSDLQRFVTQENQTQLTQTKQELRDFSTQEIDKIIPENLEQIIQTLHQKIDTEKIADEVSENLLADKEILQECINTHLASPNYAIEEKVNAQIRVLEKYISNINLNQISQMRVNALLEENKEAILNKIDLVALEKQLLEDRALKLDFEYTIKNYARRVVDENYLSAVKEILKTKATEVFEEVVALEELKEKRFLSGLNLAAISLHRELDNINTMLHAFSDVEIAKQRLEAIKETGVDKFAPYHKVHKVV